MCKFAPAALLLLSLSTVTAARPMAALDAPHAGRAVSCLNQRDIDRFKPVGDRALLFQLRNGRTYRNDLPVSCPGFARGDTGYSHASPSNRLCSGELVQLFERGSGFQYGGCTLGKFTPLASAK